ncbi:hypothetical protein [Roseimarinus sediminis]|uniref:hypothetical protein n=1 Tax=Roseimarinus sediminis TaxID=1610899 RepID=UPI003D1FB52F
MQITFFLQVGKQENNSFANFGLQGWLTAICKCVFLGAGVSFFYVREKKKQNKSQQTAPPYERSTIIINPFFVIISIFFYRINVSSWFLTLA